MEETLLSIAQRTGFSVSTVSRVLNGGSEKYHISEATAELIREEAERCNYTPSLLARGLKKQKTYTIGLVVPSLSNPYFADIASAIVKEARNYKYTVVVLDSTEDEQIERQDITTLRSRQVDAIIVVPCGTDPKYLEELDKRIPIVLVDRYFEKTSLPFATTDNYSGALAATRLLIENGHRDIACIQGVVYSMPNTQRVKGFRDAMAEAGLADKAMVAGNNFSIENGYTQAKILFQKKRHPTAIFALSNTIVMGVIKAAEEMGLKIPEDVSVISFDDSPYLDLLSPPITRISQPLNEMGVLAFNLIMERLKQKDEQGNDIPPRLDVSQEFLRPNPVLGKSIKRL